MRKQKTIGNKGFSLVELIIVIAIMAILVGVLAPQLLKYVEKTRVSSDTQFCDTVKTAITTAMLDPSVLDDSDSKKEINDNYKGKTADLTKILEGSTKFDNAVKETLGYTGSSEQTWINSNLKSTLYSSGSTAVTDYKVYFGINGNNVIVAIESTHKSGTDDATDGVIAVGNSTTVAVGSANNLVSSGS